VPQEFVSQLFDRFTRAGDADARAEGVGLGLAIVRQLAESHGGRAWYEPGDPDGARFCVWLPAAPAAAPGPDAFGQVSRAGG
jgi:signal transduction histidine kinase